MRVYPCLFGPYAILSQFEGGSMGEVFLALGPAPTARLCVIKRLGAKLARTPQMRLRFADEGRLGLRLRHRNIPETYEVGEHEGRPYVAQEFVDGKDLSGLFHDLGLDDVAERLPFALHVACELADALSYAHEVDGANLVHRDVSPPNIRVSYAGDVKLLDFGVARWDTRQAESIADGRTLLGKLGYIPPEQIRNQPLDRRADIYALGVVLWEMLARRRVGSVLEGDVGDLLANNAGRDTEATFFERAVQFVLPPPSTFAPGIPSRLDAIVARACAKSPDQRFATARELRDALLPFLPPGFDGARALSARMERVKNALRRKGRDELVVEGRALLASVSVSAVPSKLSPEPARVLRDERRPRWRPVAVVLLTLLGVLWAGSRLWPSAPRQPSVIERPAAPPILVQPLPSPVPPQAPIAAVPLRRREANVQPPTAAAPRPPASRTNPPAATSGRKLHESRPIEAPEVMPPTPEPALPAAEEPPFDARAEELAARQALARGTLPEAIKHARALVAHAPTPKAHALLADAYFSAKRFREASAEYQRIIDQDPDDRHATGRLSWLRDHPAAEAESDPSP